LIEVGVISRGGLVRSSRTLSLELLEPLLVILSAIGWLGIFAHGVGLSIVAAMLAAIIFMVVARFIKCL
jgi:hypothetical protein